MDPRKAPVYVFRTTSDLVELAFTDRRGGVSAAPRDFAPTDVVCELDQVHGRDVEVVMDGSRPLPQADALVTAKPGFTLMIRVADCVPVLLADPDAGIVGAAHCGRLGLVAGIVPNAVAAMRAGGATRLTAWVGPHICGGCYEVPAEMQAEVVAAVPESEASTTWGTPALDLGAGVRAQLERDAVTVVDVSSCTRESADLWSYRRDGAGSGRQAGLIRLNGGKK